MPDRTPGGRPLGRRAIQLGLRGRTLARYAAEWTLHIEEITDFAREQAAHLKPAAARQGLVVPGVEVYRPASDETASRIGLSPIDRRAVSGTIAYGYEPSAR